MFCGLRKESEEKKKNKLKKEVFEKNVSKIMVEKPIDNEKEDLYNFSSYVDTLLFAIKKGANFIAVDGKYGSGKSSIVNLLENNVMKRKNLGVKRRDIFSYINFMNLDQTYLQFDHDSEERNIYNRFFVNEVMNDLYSDPADYEKAFYQTSVSFGVGKSDLSNCWKLIFDKLILVLISVIIVAKISDKLLGYELPNWIVSISTLVLVICLMSLGINIYKPDAVTKSPMLDMDRCRTNFIKALMSSVAKNGTLYVVIDDLDRLKKEEQIKFISMIYNEYKPLSRQFKNIRIVFLFMVDINEIGYVESKKVFDFILPIASNQSEILQQYVNDKLALICDKQQEYDFITATILKKYHGLREIKHLFNKIIIRKNYLDSKEVQDINVCELIYMTIMVDLFDVGDISIFIDDYINNNGNADYKSLIQKGIDSTDEFTSFVRTRIAHNENTMSNTESEPLLEYLKEKNEKLDADNTFSVIRKNQLEELRDMIEDGVKWHVIDKNYYVYIYNFIEKTDLMNASELSLYNYIKESKISLDELSERLNNLGTYYRTDVVFNKIYKKIFNNDQKLVMIGKEEAWNSIPHVELLNNVSVAEAYLLKDFSNIIEKTLGHYLKQDYISEIIKYKDDFEKYNSELSLFITNSGKSFSKIASEELFAGAEISDENIAKLNELNCNLPEYVIDLIIKKNIELPYNDCIENALLQKKAYALVFYSFIFKGTFNSESEYDIEHKKALLNVVAGEDKIWYNNYAKRFNIFNIIVCRELLKEICGFDDWKLSEAILSTSDRKLKEKMINELINLGKFDILVSMLVREKENKERLINNNLLSILNRKKNELSNSHLKSSLTRLVNKSNSERKK